jgi:ankyrin repeat protein
MAEADEFSLHNAAKTGDIDSLESCLEEEGVDLDRKDHLNRTALHMAAWKGDVAIVNLLLTAGANPALSAKDGILALHFAIMKGSKDCVDALLDPNKVNRKDIRRMLKFVSRKGKQTALHYALGKNQNEDIVRSLVSAGADTSARTSQNKSPADLASTPRIQEILATTVPTIEPSAAITSVKKNTTSDYIGPTMPPPAVSATIGPSMEPSDDVEAGELTSSRHPEAELAEPPIVTESPITAEPGEKARAKRRKVEP